MNNNFCNNQNFIEWNVKNILSDNEIKKERVICIGKVQSGKTRNIIELINYAYHYFDYDIVLFMCGTNKMLKSQSETRLAKELNSFDSFSKNWIEHLGLLINNNKKFILSIMKETENLNKIYNAIKNVDLYGKKILIIDDECDYASVNTKNYSAPSRIHEKIEELYQRISLGKLVSFTATPFANIINEKNVSNDSNRTKIVVLENGSEYCGLQEFNRNQDKYYLALKDDNDKSNNEFVKEYIHYTVFIYLMTIVQKSFDTNQSIDSFKTECLINLDLSTIEHENLRENVINTLDLLIKIEEDRLFNAFCKTIQSRLRIEIFNNIDDLLFHSYYYPRFIELAKNIKKNGITILNSISKDEQNIFYNHQIKIGGVMLSRGVTYENLITELLLNYPKETIQIDTLLQRCRWFGYRKNNLKYIHILMTERLKKVFKLTEEYINLFKPGIMDFETLKSEIIQLDQYYKREDIRSTSNIKSKK